MQNGTLRASALAAESSVQLLLHRRFAWINVTAADGLDLINEYVSPKTPMHEDDERYRAPIGRSGVEGAYQFADLANGSIAVPEGSAFSDVPFTTLDPNLSLPAGEPQQILLNVTSGKVAVDQFALGDEPLGSAETCAAAVLAERSASALHGGKRLTFPIEEALQLGPARPRGSFVDLDPGAGLAWAVDASSASTHDELIVNVSCPASSKNRLASFARVGGRLEPLHEPYQLECTDAFVEHAIRSDSLLEEDVSDVVLTPKDGNVSVSSAALATGAQPSTVYTSEPRPPAAPPSAPPDVRPLDASHVPLPTTSGRSLLIPLLSSAPSRLCAVAAAGTTACSATGTLKHSFARLKSCRLLCPNVRCCASPSCSLSCGLTRACAAIAPATLVTTQYAKCSA
jgi:hypothetical protein